MLSNMRGSDPAVRSSGSAVVLHRAVAVPVVRDLRRQAERRGALDDVAADRVMVGAAAADRVDRVVQVFVVGDRVGPVGHRLRRWTAIRLRSSVLYLSAFCAAGRAAWRRWTGRTTRRSSHQRPTRRPGPRPPGPRRRPPAPTYQVSARIARASAPPAGRSGRRRSWRCCADCASSRSASSRMSAALPMPIPNASWIIIDAFLAMTSFPGLAGLRDERRGRRGEAVHDDAHGALPLRQRVVDRHALEHVPAGAVHVDLKVAARRRRGRGSDPGR